MSRPTLPRAPTSSEQSVAAKGALIALGAVLVAGGGAAIGYGVTREATGGMTAAISQLDGDIKAARAVVRERASTIANILQVQVVVEADIATAKQDVETGELKFSPQPGEVIEVGRVPSGGPAETLIVQPDG